MKVLAERPEKQLELAIAEKAAVAANRFHLLLPASPRYKEKEKWDRTECCDCKLVMCIGSKPLNDSVEVFAEAVVVYK